MKLAMTDWWGQSARFLGMLDVARAEGIDVTGDVYPYDVWHSDLTVLFPKRDFTNRENAQFALEHVSPPDGIILSSYSPEPALVGLSLAEIAKRKGKDPAQTLMDLIARSSGAGARAVDHRQGACARRHRSAHRLAVRQHLFRRLAGQPASARSRRIHEGAACLRARTEAARAWKRPSAR